MTEQLLGVFAVWIVWTVADHFLEAPQWIWYACAVAGGIVWEVALNPSWWWLGVGVGGAAAFVYLLADLILLATDAAKVSVLRKTRT